MNAFIKKADSAPSFFWALFFTAIFIRLLAAFFLPVIDPSEARYAEIARKLVEVNDWITLYHDYGMPFWAKPPLSTWLSSIGMLFFGINEFAARLPLFLISLGIVGLVYSFAKQRSPQTLPVLSSLILLTGPLFYIASATIMTDMPLIFGMTLSMVAFWNTVRGHNPRFWGYLFFVGQAIGLLSKGPLCFALTGFPLFVWVVSTRSIKETWKKFPWILGTCLMLAIAGPWYVLAELKTPGFLYYFIVGEHINRFLVKGWEGDLYGHAHSSPLGLIWLYWAGATFPWILWFIGFCFQKRGHWKSIFFEDKWRFYLLLWTFSPILFFTFSGNIIWTYVLPSIPAFSLLISEAVAHTISNKNKFKYVFYGSVLLAPLIMLGVVTYSLRVPETLNNQRRLVQHFMSTYKDSFLVYYCHNCYSAEFYSGRQVPLIREESELRQLLKRESVFVAMRKRKIDELPPDIRELLEKVQEYGSTTLFKKIK